MANRGNWKLSIGGSSFADYTDVLQPLDHSGGPMVLEFPGYGAAAPYFSNLGNFKGARHYQLDRIHATDKAAHDWWQTAAATWAGVADVVLTHLNYDGTETTYTIAGAKIEISVGMPNGVSTTSKIIITGGAAT